MLDDDVQKLEAQIKELKDALIVSENSRFQMELTMQAMRTEFERALSANFYEDYESKSSLSNDVAAGIDTEYQSKFDPDEYVTLRTNPVSYDFNSTVSSNRITQKNQIEEYPILGFMIKIASICLIIIFLHFFPIV